jgi:spore germination protein YaaH
VFGYHPYWMGTAWQNYNYNLISTIAYFSAEATATGGLSDLHGWPVTGLINTAHANGVDVVLCVTLFSNSALVTLLGNATYRQNLIDNLLTQVQAGNADGINVDFESFPASQKQNMVQFITDLTNTFHTEIPGSQVTLATPAVDWNDGWDYNALATVSDGLFIMGYDYYYSGSSSTGPNSPLTGNGYSISWTVNDYLNKTNNQPEKLIIGYPYFGFEWPATSSSAGAPTTDTGTAKFYAEMEGNALSYGKLWHESSQTPWYHYQNPNWVQGWYDDSLSLSLKYDFAINNDLLGVGIWAMGYDGSNPELWDLLSAKFGAIAPPTTPTRLIIKNIGNGGVMIDFQGSQAADAYVVLRGYLGSNTLDTLGNYTQRPIIINNLNTSETYFLSVSAMNGFGFSPQTELMGVIPSTGNVKCLIINGFDRINGTNNTFDYIKQHGSAFHAQGYPFDNATNEAVIEGDIDLDNYAVVDWILGEEGTATSSFIGAEQDLVESYLENGGFLFVSGSEIGYDLSSEGSTSDNQFFQNYLKANYISDAAGGQQGTYSCYGVTNSLFDGISDITFDNGTHGTYDVDWPDGVKPANGAEVCAKYNDVDYETRGGMGISYTGTFGNSSENGGVVFLSVGFETIYPESKRDQLLDRILDFYETELSIVNNSQVALPEAVSIHALYPNPTNSSLTLEFLSDLNNEVVQIAIIDILGRKVKTVVIPLVGTYKHTWVWDGLDDSNRELPAGVYIVSLTSGHTIDAKKVTILK